MSGSLKYSVIERERRFLVRHLPDGVAESSLITDYYIESSRLRLRQVDRSGGLRVRKLGHKVRLSGTPYEVACTSIYLDDAEWELLRSLASRCLRKTRHHVVREGWAIAVDEFEDGTLLAEIDDGDQPSSLVPSWLDVVREVTAEEAWTGAGLAARIGRAVGGDET